MKIFSFGSFLALLTLFASFVFLIFGLESPNAILKWELIGFSAFIFAVGLGIAFIVETIEGKSTAWTSVPKLREENNDLKQKTVAAQLFACPTCGAKLNPEAAKGNFCYHCGSKLRS